MLQHTLRLALLVGFAALAPLPLAAEAVQSSLSGNYLAGRHAGSMRDAGIAARYFADALAEDPGNPLLIERTFMLDLASGRIADAEEFAAKVISYNSQQRMARLVLGLKALRGNQPAEARAHFKETAYTPAGQLTAALLNAWSYAAERNPVQAFAALDSLDANESFANFKSYHVALLADYLGLTARADQAFRQAYTALPSSLRLVQAYANFLVRQGRSAEALKIYGEFLSTAEKNPLILAAVAEAKTTGAKPRPFVSAALDGAGESLFSLASALAGDQGLDTALAYAQLTVSVLPNSDVAHTLLGDIYEDLQRYEDAIAAYDSVAENSPLMPNAEIESAINLQRLEKSVPAQARLTALLDRDPKNYEAIITLGNLQRSAENFGEAVKAYTRAIDMTPSPGKDQWSLYYYRGIANERNLITIWGYSCIDRRFSEGQTAVT